MTIHLPLAPLLPPIEPDHTGELGIPVSCIPWPLEMPEDRRIVSKSAPDLVTSLARANALGPWDWPDRPAVFISDLHADAESLLRSLVAARAIVRHGPGLTQFTLTPFGRNCQVIIGGDCIDKGPSNLDLLTSLGALRSAGADLVLLAGNHDLRLLLGLEALTVKRGSLNAHMFVRMGKKVLPLLKEIHDRHVDTDRDMANLPDEATCVAQIMPGKQWEDEFPKAARRYMNEAAIDREIKRLRRKTRTFMEWAGDFGLSARKLYAAALKCRELLVGGAGEYAWFYREMRAAHQSGSLLFVHAGIDDHMAGLISSHGVAHVNERFKRESQSDPFVFYSGTIANLMRTKYRPVDHPLTEKGVEDLHASGIKLLVHGHVNRRSGQELKSKHGLLHLEADITLDRHSRSTEGLEGIGTGATIIYPDGNILGISRDFPHAKLFNPAHILKQHGLSR